LNGAANAMHFAEFGLSWQVLRVIVDACPESPVAVRKSLAEIGDEAVHAAGHSYRL